jgi:hypothetical protein
LRLLRLYESQFSGLNRGPLGWLEHPHVIRFEVQWCICGAG